MKVKVEHPPNETIGIPGFDKDFRVFVPYFFLFSFPYIMSTPVVVATMALQGAATGVSCELAVRSLFRKKDKNTNIKVAKFILGLCMAIKSIVFLSFHAK